jgi:hypothetical protein
MSAGTADALFALSQLRRVSEALMPRFYFDLIEGEGLRDEEGRECADLEGAADYAMRSARDIAAVQALEGELSLDHAIAVRDESGVIVLRLKLGEALVLDGLTTPLPLLLPLLSLLPFASLGLASGIA